MTSFGDCGTCGRVHEIVTLHVLGGVRIVSCPGVPRDWQLSEGVKLYGYAQEHWWRRHQDTTIEVVR